MKIRMYDMRFGDCFLLQEGAEYFLVDFGSDTKFNLEDVADDIKNTCGKNTLSVLLTHFHKDHINGFHETELPKNVNISTIYLPNVIAMNARNCEINYLQLHILREIFEAVVLQKSPSTITLYKLLEDMMKAKSKVVFLQRNNEFVFAKRKYDVLWPCFDELQIHGKTVKRIIKVAEWIGLVSGEKTERIEHVEDDLKQIKLKIVQTFIDELAEAYVQLSNRQEVDSDIMQKLEAEYGKIDKWIAGVSKELDDSKKREIKSVIQRMVKEENRISIVFQDRSRNDCSKLLMTGDAAKSDLKKVIDNKIADTLKISRKIGVIKLPHHGTTSHYLSDLPNCKRLLASNGEGNPQRGKIAYEYGGFYVSNRLCQMLCTNKRCELREISGVVKVKLCNNCNKNENDKIANGKLYLEIDV